jgi:hypothetical protein
MALPQGHLATGRQAAPKRWREHERERAYWHEQHRLNEEQRELDARRRALHDERRFNEENGFYGR